MVRETASYGIGGAVGPRSTYLFPHCPIAYPVTDRGADGRWHLVPVGRMPFTNDQTRCFQDELSTRGTGYGAMNSVLALVGQCNQRAGQLFVERAQLINADRKGGLGLRTLGAHQQVMRAHAGSSQRFS